jgi:hypothetical protein
MKVNFYLVTFNYYSRKKIKITLTLLIEKELKVRLIPFSR